ncbi:MULTISPECIES: HhH-GPD family protein [Nostocales]|uniref:Adenine DNA glycosylase n=3 Tax=Nostocales TaxID=1161 RepID=A0A8S9T0P7_9CYAN|nr:A/G-specific adenine glycosylase [Tolypothrix bouteillei]KAF3886191.1 A/G-specific adenine glycosylase [Tolypothrix bouteillei VB521301]
MSGHSIYLNKEKLKWFREQLLTWAKLNRRQFAWRNTQDPYAILVAEVFLQKTNAPSVASLYEIFMQRYPTVGLLANASVAEISGLLQPLGLAFRAERLHKSAQIIVKDYGGKIPEQEAQLLKLPGVGKYIARSVCANAFGQPKAVIDTNVARILERFFGLQGGRVKSRCPLLWQAAEQAAPANEVGAWNLALFDFGAGVCTARNPLCAECPLRHQCNDCIQKSSLQSAQ